MVLGATVNQKANISIVINETLVQERGWSALQMIKEISPLIKGGGGGQPFYATAGGTEISGMVQAIENVKTTIS
jgi:alanyl-tRNA synthetase